MEHKQRLIELIETAKRDVTEAEGDLEKIIGEIQVQVRADKMTMSAGVDRAFEKLRAARRILSDLEEIVTKAPG